MSFDLPAAVWNVLQSLPTHPALLKQVRDMPYDKTGGSIRVLLNLASPFRLLYILQMVESFLAEGDRVYLCHSPQVSDWAMQFLYMGGAEHLVYLTEYTIKTILFKSSEQETKNEIIDGKKVSLEKQTQKANIDAAVLTLGLLYRTIHRLLLFDPEYSRWQVPYVTKFQTAF